MQITADKMVKQNGSHSSNGHLEDASKYRAFALDKLPLPSTGGVVTCKLFFLNIYIAVYVCSKTLCGFF